MHYATATPYLASRPELSLKVLKGSCYVSRTLLREIKLFTTGNLFNTKKNEHLDMTILATISPPKTTTAWHYYLFFPSVTDSQYNPIHKIEAKN